MKRGPVMTLATSFSTLGWVPPGPRDFCTYSWSSKFQTRSGSAGSLSSPNAFPKFIHLFLCVVCFIFPKEKVIKGLLQDTLEVKVIWDFSSSLFLSTPLLGLLFSFPQHFYYLVSLQHLENLRIDVELLEVTKYVSLISNKMSDIKCSIHFYNCHFWVLQLKLVRNTKIWPYWNRRR